MARVELKELKSWRDWLPMAQIRVQPQQRKFTSNLLLSYLQSTHPAVSAFALFLSDELIGYVMLVHADNPIQWIIARLTIDQRYQRQGHGYDVTDQLIDMIYEFDNSEMVVARYKPDNEAARQLFAKLKFEEQESMHKGRNIAILEFEFEENEDEDSDEIDEADELDEDTSDEIEDTDDEDEDTLDDATPLDDDNGDDEADDD